VEPMNAMPQPSRRTRGTGSVTGVHAEPAQIETEVARLGLDGTRQVFKFAEPLMRALLEPRAA
jgi:hypothetical protein